MAKIKSKSNSKKIPEHWKFAAAVAGGNPKAKDIVLRLRVFKNFDALLYWLMRFGICGENLVQYWKENDSSDLMMVNDLIKRVRKQMARPILSIDMV